MHRCQGCGNQVGDHRSLCEPCLSLCAKTKHRTRALRARKRDPERIIQPGFHLSDIRPSTWRGISVAIIVIAAVLGTSVVSVSKTTARDEMESATANTCIKLRKAGITDPNCPTKVEW